MIFNRKNAILAQLLLCLSILLAGCGGNHDAVSSISPKDSEPLRSAPESSVLIINGPRSNYSLINSGDEFMVTDKVGNGGTISARGKTSIKFNDVSVNLLVEKKSQTIAEKDLNTLIELYIAFFNRVPDADGLSYWIDQIKAGMTTDQLATNFYFAAIQFTEVTHYSANMTSADFVKIIYKNVLGRAGDTAPSDKEVNYWSDELDSGRASKGRLVFTMLYAAHTFAGDAKWGWVPQLLDNKVNVGKFFAVEQGLNFNTPEESITQGVAIAAAISPTDISKAKEQIPIPDKNFSLSKSITSMVLTPNYSYIDIDATQAHQLHGIYVDGSTQTLSTSNWTSSNPAVATINGLGIAKGVKPGSTTITAEYGSKRVSANLVVNAAKLTSISLSPNANTITTGASQNLTATGLYSDGTSTILVSNMQWTSSNPSVATVSDSGAIKGIKAGSTKISVTSGSITAYVDVKVIAALQSITISPSNATIALGYSQQFTATATYSDGTSTVITPTWSSNNVFAANIDSFGLAKSGMSAGATTIVATFNGVSASANLNVNAAKLTSISLSPNANTIATGASQNLTATGLYSDGTSTVLVSNMQWISSNPSVATVSDSGAIKGIKAGNTKISVTSGSITADVDVKVIAALQSITISPSNATIALGYSQQFTATATYSDGTSTVITPTWSSNNVFAASIDSFGLAKSSMSAGASTIVATFNGISASANLTITNAVISSIKLSTLYEKSFPVGVTQALSAKATMSDGWSKDVTNTVVWTSSNPTVASVANGVVTPLSAGTTMISATSRTQSASYSFVVNAATPTSMSIGGPDAGPDSMQANTFAQGSSRELTLGVFFSDGTFFSRVSGSWVSSDTSKMTISNSGVFSAIAPGTVTLSASFRGLTAKRNISIATTVNKPSILLTCNVASPMSISAATWNAAYTSDPSNLTRWLDVDWASCNSRVVVKLVDVKSNYLMFEANTSPNGTFYPGAVSSTGRTPQLTAGDVIRIGYSDSLGVIYYTLYSITVQP